MITMRVNASVTRVVCRMCGNFLRRSRSNVIVAATVTIILVMEILRSPQHLEASLTHLLARFSSATNVSTTGVGHQEEHNRELATFMEKNQKLIATIENESVIISDEKRSSTDVSRKRKEANPHSYKYTIDPRESCQDDTFLVTFVMTAPDHFLRRRLIRDTWGDVNHYTYKVLVYFMLGQPATNTIQAKVVREAAHYKDIIQEDFLDTYKNLTVKVVGAMRWVTSRCPRVRFVVKTDDDAFVNLFPLLDYLNDMGSDKVHTTRLLMGRRSTGTVQRGGKWAVSISDMPDKFYPPYLSGIGYVMSLDVALLISRTSEYIPFFMWEDVYITGIIPKALRLEHVQIDRHVCLKHDISRGDKHHAWTRCIFWHKENRDIRLRSWQLLVKLESRGKVPRIDLSETLKSRRKI